jgi:hypothetical protein
MVANPRATNAAKCSMSANLRHRLNASSALHRQWPKRYGVVFSPAARVFGDSGHGGKRRQRCERQRSFDAGRLPNTPAAPPDRALSLESP